MSFQYLKCCKQICFLWLTCSSCAILANLTIPLGPTEIYTLVLKAENVVVTIDTSRSFIFGEYHFGISRVDTGWSHNFAFESSEGNDSFGVFNFTHKVEIRGNPRTTEIGIRADAVYFPILLPVDVSLDSAYISNLKVQCAVKVKGTEYYRPAVPQVIEDPPFKLFVTKEAKIVWIKINSFLNFEEPFSVRCKYYQPHIQMENGKYAIYPALFNNNHPENIERNRITFVTTTCDSLLLEKGENQMVKASKKSICLNPLKSTGLFVKVFSGS